MKKLILSFLVILSIGLSCKDEIAKPKLEPTINLVFEDASCTEVWLKLSVVNVNNPTVSLKRNDSLIATYVLTPPDTTIIDEGLLPSRPYTYTASLLIDSKTYNSTTEARTMDTTSHDFTWQTFTLGDGTGSSCLYDVAIINDTLAYACGAIYSGGERYNLARWNGISWTLENVTVNFRGNLISPPLYGVFAFSATDIWFSSGVPIHGNGQTWTQYHLFDMGILSQSDGSVNKIWGSNSSNIYFVGDLGTIVYYSSGVWRKIESGTNLQFLDIYGSGNEILAVCTQNYPGNRGIYSIKVNTATQISSYPIQWELFSIWFVPNRHYYVVGGDYYEKKGLNDSNWRIFYPPTQYAASHIRGNELNNAFIVGAYGECLHWNGLTWSSLRNTTGLTNGSYAKVAIKENMCIIVGENSARAVISIGRRY